MKTIKVLETFLAHGQRFIEGEIRKVTPEQAGHYCGCGWAEDLDGELETGARDTTPKELAVNGSGHNHAAEEPK